MSEVQKTQMVALKQRLEAENKELKSCQTKKSMEDAKLIQVVGNKSESRKNEEMNVLKLPGSIRGLHSLLIVKL